MVSPHSPVTRHVLVVTNVVEVSSLAQKRTVLAQNTEMVTPTGGSRSGDQAKDASVSGGILLHPLMLLILWIAGGCLFAIQQYSELRGTPQHLPLSICLVLWAIYTGSSAVCFLSAWIPLRDRILTASGWFLASRMLPLSLLLGALSEIIYARIFPLFVHPIRNLTYWQRVKVDLTGEWITNVAFFWIAIFLTRGIYFYQQSRLKEIANAQLSQTLKDAQLRSLRMQMNPHFLFNTLHGVSSLMHQDLHAADRVLEQLSSMLRISFANGDAPFVTLSEEVSFVHLYLSILCTRMGDRLKYEIQMPPALGSAKVPAMILQPLVENAYTHGIAKITRNGTISLEAVRTGSTLRITVTNDGIGIAENASRQDRVGLHNVKARLQLLFGADQRFSLREVQDMKVEATIEVPFVPTEEVDS